jgi:hypothetical protein
MTLKRMLLKKQRMRQHLAYVSLFNDVEAHALEEAAQAGQEHAAGLARLKLLV